MDAGLAGLLGGVIGAAVGALGAAGSAYITARKAEQQARVQAQTQLAQAQLQLRLEHLNQRREPRAQAYTAVLSLATEILQLLERALGCQEMNDEAGFHALAQEIEEKLKGFQTLYTRVRVEGPDSMIEPTRQMENALHEILHPIEDPLGDFHEDISEFRNEAQEAVWVFTDAARKALNDDELTARLTAPLDRP
ncbi:hypothetical protein [Streptomyces afghaniensis]|uniref:hypothetical protein n=1 Tax=Streptomyces afghaniensis TaxID=66865 RepID=UPI0027855B22|nr:hypothetical protein [Streptomyces afghaniensis]MDQ1013529.1 hypothetical protein [Streptomyces afghaniensis]